MTAETSNAQRNLLRPDMDNYRIRELIEFADRLSRDYSLPNADIAAFRDTAAALRDLMQRSQPPVVQQPEARGVADEARSERAWPVIGNLYLVKIGGVLQHEVFMFDQGDCEPGGSAPTFWSRDGLDDCPEFDPHNDQWISLDEIAAALTEARNVR